MMPNSDATQPFFWPIFFFFLGGGGGAERKKKKQVRQAVQRCFGLKLGMEVCGVW